MGDVFKQQYRNRDGSKGESRRWYGQYRDRDGVLQRVPLAADKVAARSMLRQLERDSERGRAGIGSGHDASALLPELESAYLDDMKLRGRGARHRDDTKRLLRSTIEACGFTSVGSLRPGPLDSYLAGMSCAARTKETYRQSIVGFANWLVKKGKLAHNPLSGASRPEGNATLIRRALSPDQLRNLLEVARGRPLDEGLKLRNGPNKGARGRKLRPEVVAKLMDLGQERYLLYKMAYYSGLRRKELRALIVADLVLDGDEPRLFLPRERTKGNRDARLPLRLDYARELRDWIETRGLLAADPIFRVYRDTAKVVRRDLKAAGIPYRDERGRVFDFHAFRKCLATHLNAAGVPIVTAKEMLRHTTVELTAGVYNDEELHDLRGAIDRLPEF